MPSTCALTLFKSAAESRNVHISCWQVPLKAAGKNASTTGPFFSSWLSVTSSRFWLWRVKSGALAPTSTDIEVSLCADRIFSRGWLVVCGEWLVVDEERSLNPSAISTAATPLVPWYRTITREQWRVLLAAKFGWMLDAMDFMLYTMAVGQLRAYFGFGDDMAGFLGTATLVMSGVGGAMFGYIADRFGRTRALMGTILMFSFASLGAATSQTVWQLLFWRAILGIGMGGEWASGAVLVSETWPAHLRNKAISIMQSGWALGYMLASISAAIILGAPALGADAWRWLFVVGVLPAFLTLWIRRYVKEPDTWTARAQKTGGASPFAVIFGRTLIRRTLLIIALGSAVQFADWGLFFWLPAFLARPVEQGGAGMGIVGSLPWIIPVQLGAYAGYLTFGFIADRIGRRQAFVLYMVSAAL